MTKQALFDLMISNPKSEIFRHFDRLPDAVKDEEVAERWISHCAVHNLGESEAFIQIENHRPELITDKLRFLHVSVGSGRGLLDISPDDTSAYLEIALQAIKNSAQNMGLLDDRFHTEEMLQEIVRECPDRLDPALGSQSWIRPLLTEEMKSEVSKSNLKFALTLDENDISKDQWHRLFKENARHYAEVEKRGRFHLLVDFLRDGGWPDPVEESSFVIAFTPVDTIQEALNSFMKAKSYGPRMVLFKALIHTFPIEQVLAEADHHSFMPAIAQIYPEAELREQMKISRVLRAYLLESDLGM
jgi:hypothetical protein